MQITHFCRLNPGDLFFHFYPSAATIHSISHFLLCFFFLQQYAPDFFTFIYAIASLVCVACKLKGTTRQTFGLQKSKFSFPLHHISIPYHVKFSLESHSVVCLDLHYSYFLSYCLLYCTARNVSVKFFCRGY